LTSEADVRSADAAALATWVRSELLHPRHGVATRPRRHHRLVPARDAFLARDVVGWLVERLSLRSRTQAVAVGEALRAAGAIARASGKHRPFRDGGGVYVAAAAAAAAAPPPLSATPSAAAASGRRASTSALPSASSFASLGDYQPDGCLPLLSLLLSSSPSARAPPGASSRRLLSRGPWRDGHAAAGAVSAVSDGGHHAGGGGGAVAADVADADATVAEYHLSLTADDTDLASLDFWAKDVFTPGVAAGHVFTHRQVVHPFPERPAAAATPPAASADADGESSLCSSSSSAAWSRFFGAGPPRPSAPAPAAEAAAPADEAADPLVSQAVVSHVFSSIARPLIVELRRPTRGETVRLDAPAARSPAAAAAAGGATARGSCAVYVGDAPSLAATTTAAAAATACGGAVDPPPRVGASVLVKAGDNLLQDQAVETMLRLFNHLWRAAAGGDAAAAPFAPTYAVLPTDARAGLIEVLPDLSPLRTYDWDVWVDRAAADTALVDTLVRSAAGAYVGAYVLGCRDRHWDNIGVMADGALAHIDFGYVINQAPPMDGPRFSLSPGLQGALGRVGAWERFVATTGAAFATLRARAPVVVRAAVLAFGHAGFASDGVRGAVLGAAGLAVGAPSAAAAEAAVTDQVRSSATEWRGRLKRASHASVDPAFYALLRLRFPPAVLAMRLVEARRSQPVVPPPRVAGERDVCV